MDTNVTIQQAIAEMQDFAKETPMFAGSPKAAKIAEYLQELAALKDETKIYDTIFFIECGFSENTDVIPYEWHHYVNSDTTIRFTVSFPNIILSVDINDTTFKCPYEIQTRGQFRMFLTGLGLSDYVKRKTLND